MGSTQQVLLGYGSTLASGAFSGKLYNTFYWQGRTQEPVTRQLQINYASNLTHGLVFLALPGGARWADLVNGNLGNLANGISQWFNTEFVLRYGYGKGASTGDVTAYPWSPSWLSITNQCTLLTWLAISSLSSGFATFLSIPHNSSYTSPFGALDFTRNSSTSGCNFNYVASGTQVTVSSDTGMISADNTMRLYAVTRDGAAATFYRDGFQFGAQKTLGTNSNVDFGSQLPIAVGNRALSSPGNSMGGTFTLAAMWNRSLSPSEIALLYLNPLALLIPPPY